MGQSGAEMRGASRELNRGEMLAAVDDAIFLLGLSGQVIDTNRAACELLGRSWEQLTAGNICDWTSEEDPSAGRVRAHLKEAMDAGTARFEWRGRWPDGSRAWCDVRLVRCSNPPESSVGEPCVVAVFRDIQAQEALSKSAERFEKIVQASPDPMAIVRREDSVVLYMNPAAEDLFGWASTEMVGKTATALNLWADPGAREEFLEVFRREGRVDSKLVSVRSKSGALTEGLLSVRAIEIDGAPAMLTSFRDVSELRRARLELEVSEARLRALSEATFEGIGRLERGIVVDTNEQLAAMYRTSRESIIGRNIMEFVAPESRAQVRARIEQRIEGAYEHLGLRADGSIFPVEVRARSLVLKDGLARVTAIRDVTERKAAEAERERLITELKARNAEMEQFTYTVSHDLKSPLVTISGFIGALERDLRAGDAERVQSDLARIRSAAEKMSGLLSDLLELSRVGRVGGVLQPVSMAVVAHEAEELVSGVLGERHISLVIAPDLPEVRGDRARLVQVVQNLLENAAKYMGAQPEPRVELGVRAELNHWVFFVRDNGIGIEPRYAERIFGLFQKLDPRSTGTGIGLALARKIVEFHGGTIWAESDGQQGSTFLFRLPRLAVGVTSTEQNGVASTS